MGRPADRIKSARRPGKRERARVKSFRSSVWTTAPSGETIHVKYGRKKARRICGWLNKLWDERRASASIGEPVKHES